MNKKGSNLLGLDWSDHFRLTSLETSALQSTKGTQTLNTEVQANFLNSVKESKLQHLKKNTATCLNLNWVNAQNCKYQFI